MDKLDFDKFVSGRLAGTIQVCNGRALNQPALDAWSDALCEFSVNEVIDALSDWPKYHKAVPTPYDIAKAITETRSRSAERTSQNEVSARSNRLNGFFAPTPMPKWCIERLQWLRRYKIPAHLSYYRLRFIELHPEIALRPLFKVQIDWLRNYESRCFDLNEQEMLYAVYAHGLGVLVKPDGSLYQPDTFKPTKAQMLAAELLGIDRQTAISDLTFSPYEDVAPANDKWEAA